MLDGVGRDVHPEDQGQTGDVVQIFRQPMMAEHESEAVAGQATDQGTQGQRLEKAGQGLAHRGAVGFRDDELEHQDAEQGADGIDHDPFPAEDVGHPGRGANGTQHGCDHRGPRHHGDGPEQAGQLPTEIQQPVGGHRDDEPGDQYAHGQEPADDGFQAPDFVKPEREAAFEQDHGHRQRNDRQQQGPEYLLRIEPAGDRSGRDPGQEQEQDRRQPQPPSQPLAGDGHQADGPQG